MGIYDQHGFIISADLGQVNDYTAITVIERFLIPPSGRRLRQCRPDELRKEYHLRHIERPELGTPYTAIVARLLELHNKTLNNMLRAAVIDVTGVGRPVWDYMLQNGFRRAALHGIQITGGATVKNEGAIFNVPKRDLVSALQVAFQNKDLKIAQNIPHADTLVKELTNFKVKINVNGHDQYEAWREGIHDDIVLSAAMGVWLASRNSVWWR